MAAYFASRQWVRGDPARRQRAVVLGEGAVVQPGERVGALERSRSTSARARSGSSYWTGHWQGQGEPFGGDDPGPGGSLDDVISVDEGVLQARRDDATASCYERVVPLLRLVPAPIVTYNVPSTRAMQQQTRFVRVRVARR